MKNNPWFETGKNIQQLANLAAAAYIFGQNLFAPTFDQRSAIVGLVVWGWFYLFGLLIMILATMTEKKT